MASPRPAHAEGGYATAAAVMVSLTLAVVASAVETRALQALELARADAERAALERDLGDAAAHAILTLLKTKQSARLHWSEPSNLGPIEILAEPERAKLALDQSSALETGVRRKLGLTDADANGQSFAGTGDPFGIDLSALRPSPMWRACASSLFSPWGGSQLNLRAAVTPAPGPPAWRAGDVWRLRLSARGWSEDRIVRFTGDPDRPAAIVRRRLNRGREGGRECDALLTPNQAV